MIVTYFVGTWKLVFHTSTMLFIISKLFLNTERFLWWVLDIRNSRSLLARKRPSTVSFEKKMSLYYVSDYKTKTCQIRFPICALLPVTWKLFTVSDWASSRGILVQHDGEQRSRGIYLDVYTPNDQSRAQTRETIELFERNRRTIHGNFCWSSPERDQYLY